VNVPLKDGMEDESYRQLFQPIIRHLVEWYRPQLILLQCGSDSLTGDRLGSFNLTIRGQAECVRFVKSFGIPILVAGGGGYTVRNVARCWAYETVVLLDKELPDQLPYNDYLGYSGPDYRLHLQPSNMENLNTGESLCGTLENVVENLRLPCAPSIHVCRDNPDLLLSDSDDSENELFDERRLAKYLTAKLRIDTVTGRESEFEANQHKFM
jgi:histone deacetylase 1/2